jgi:hypothetical protein
MFVGDRMHGRIFQVDETRYNQRMEILKRHLQNLPSSVPELKKMGLDYLFWGRPEIYYFGVRPPLKKLFCLGDTALYSLE